MKIANIIEEGRFGGPHERIIQISLPLSRYGIHTTVIYPILDSSFFSSKLRMNNIFSKQLPLSHLSKDVYNLLRFILSFAYETIILYKFIKTHKFDIIHCSGGSWQYKGILASRLAGIKNIWELNDTKQPVFIKILFRVISSLFANGYIVVGDRVHKYYFKKKIHKPVYNIPSPVDAHFFSPDIVTSDKYIDTLHGIKIISIGNISPVKGFEYLIFAFQILAQKFQHQDIHLIIVGNCFDSQKKYMLKLKNFKDNFKLANIHFYGYSKDVRPLLKASDIYVCSSIAEASSISIREAMSMKKPVIATDVGDNNQFVIENQTGYIVNAYNYELMAAKLDILIHNSELRCQLGKNARQIIVDNYHITKILQLQIEAYQNILSK